MKHLGLLIAISCFATAGNLAAGQNTTPSIDEQLRKALAEGHERCQRGDHEGSFQAYRQGLLAADKQLAQRPELQIVIDVGLARAQGKPRREGAAELAALLKTVRDHQQPTAKDPPGEVNKQLAQRREQIRQLEDAEKWTEALAGYRALIADEVPIFGTDHKQITEDLYDLSTAHIELNNYAQAIPLLRRCIGIVKARPLAERRGLPTLMEALGHAYQKTSDFKRALETYQKCLDIRASLKQSPARTLHHQGILFLELDRSDEARANIEAALKEYRANQNPSDDVRHDHIESHHELAKLFTMNAQYLEAHEQLKDGRALLAKLKSKDLVLEAQNQQYLAELLRYQGEIGKSIKLYERIVAAKNQPPATLANSQQCLADLYSLVGQPRDAERLYNQSRKKREELKLYPEVALVLGSLGNLYMNQERYAEAEKALVAALKIRKDIYGNTKLAVAVSLGQLASLYERTGKGIEAEQLYRQAIEIKKVFQGEQHPDVALELNNLARLWQSEGDLVKAGTYSRQALHALQVSTKPIASDKLRLDDLRIHPNAVFILANHAELLQESFAKKPDVKVAHACDHTCKLAADVLERLRKQNLETQESKNWMTGGQFKIFPLRIKNLRQLFSLETDQHYLETAFATAEQGTARTFVEFLAGNRANRLAGVSAAFQEEESRLLETMQKLDLQIKTESDRPLQKRQPDLIGKLLAQQKAAEGSLRDLIGRIEKAHPQYVGLKYPRPCQLEEARACLAPDEIALLFVPGSEASFIVLVEARPRPGDQANGLAIIELPRKATLDEHVAGLTDMETLGLPARTRLLGRQAFDAILGPCKDRLKDKSLVIVPNGSLCFLPFELLVEEDGKYLVEKHCIRYAPSLTALHLISLWKQKRVAPETPLFAVGDPVYGDAYQRLEHSGYEVAEIAKLLKAKDEFVLTRDKASKSEVKKLSAANSMSKARYVHFATHGILGLDRGKQPALVLNQTGTEVEESLLQMDEITGLKLNADLVVLSACKSGQGRLHQGEGVTGLARAFLYAGSKGVMCSLWSVDDRETANLMVDFYGHLQKGKSAPAALREAQLAMIQAGKAPLFWAPFIVIGE